MSNKPLREIGRNGIFGLVRPLQFRKGEPEDQVGGHTLVDMTLTLSVIFIPLARAVFLAS